MRILVTGATGFIGRSLVPLLVAQPDTAVSLLLLESEIQQPLPPPLNNLRLQLVSANLRNLRQTQRAVGKIAPDAVIHLAAVGVTDPFLDINTALRTNLNGALNLARACFESSGGVRQMLVARTPGEESLMNVYAASKAAAWGFCQMFARTQGWPITGGTIFQAYGPHQTERNLIPAAMRSAAAGQDFPMTAGVQKRDWIYSSDIAKGFLALLNANLPAGTSIELGTGRLTSVAEVVGQVYALVGGSGRPQIGAIPSRPGEEAVQAADTARTKELIGWETAVSLESGLRKLYNRLCNAQR